MSEKDQCNLCDENCKSETDLYHKGDFKEILQDREVYIAINNNRRKHCNNIAITDENKYCYICISYYNTSQHTFTFDDIVIVKYQNYSENDLNVGRTWDVQYKGPRGGNKDAYRFWSTKGT